MIRNLLIVALTMMIPVAWRASAREPVHGHGVTKAPVGGMREPALSSGGANLLSSRSREKRYSEAKQSTGRSELVTVQKGVNLEVIDWGGTGRPAVLLTGLGNTAHVYDGFAPLLAQNYHVYGITRRGFGASSVPVSGYSADRLGDDVLAVLKKLGIERPVLIGHSIAGEELSSIATRHPASISGLVYLDAANEYAFYDRKHGAYMPDLATLYRQVEKMRQKDPLDPKAMRALQADMSTLQRSLQDTLTTIQGDVRNASAPTKADLATFSAMQQFVARQICARIPESELRQTFRSTPDGGVGAQRAPDFVYSAILNGEQKYGMIDVPTLALVAEPEARCHIASSDQSRLESAEARETTMKERQYETVRKLDPSVDIVRIAHASHYIFLSNEGDVLDSIRAFIRGLPPQPNAMPRSLRD